MHKISERDRVTKRIFPVDFTCEKNWFEMESWELRMMNDKLRLAQIFFTLCVFCGAIVSIKAQSVNADFPTPVTSNEIDGIVRARDVGDARLTSYYYVFNGSQGDVFINVTANNFNGDIDVFAAEGLRPLSKIRLYADTSPTETGRIVYLRQPLKLILRIEGRTPDDNPATFKIKFAGSFVAYQKGTETGEPDAPEIKSAEEGAVKVNSVGTIIEDKKEKSADEKTAETKPSDESPQNSESSKEIAPKAVAADKVATENKNESDNEKTNEKTGEIESGNKTEEAKSKTPVVKNKKTVRRKPIKIVTAETTKEVKIPPASPLENVRLIVLMKNGDKFEYPMTEVFRFSLNNNILTVILKDGKIERRSIFDIQKFSVE
ncbi:MAG: hypothetical protein ACR2N3_13685 [Pyrinomonadaceae bacterium]